MEIAFDTAPPRRVRSASMPGISTASLLNRIERPSLAERLGNGEDTKQSPTYVPLFHGNHNTWSCSSQYRPHSHACIPARKSCCATKVKGCPAVPPKSQNSRGTRQRVGCFHGRRRQGCPGGFRVQRRGTCHSTAGRGDGVGYMIYFM